MFSCSRRWYVTYLTNFESQWLKKSANFSNFAVCVWASLFTPPSPGQALWFWVQLQDKQHWPQSTPGAGHPSSLQQASWNLTTHLLTSLLPRLINHHWPAYIRVGSRALSVGLVEVLPDQLTVNRWQQIQKYRNSNCSRLLPVIYVVHYTLQSIKHLL